MEYKNIVVNYTGRKGGGAVYAYEMTKGLIEANCNVYAIVAEDIENKDKWKKLNLKELIFLPTYSTKQDYIVNTVRFKFFGLKKLKEQFKHIQVDAVYVPMIQPWSNMVNSVFKSSQKIVTLHDPKPHSGSSVYFNYLCKKTAKRADDIVILSEKFKQYTETYFNKTTNQVHVIPHGIFDYYKKNNNKENVIHYDTEKINFLFFGRITKYKGLHILSKAYKILSNEFDNISLTVVGNGDFEEYKDEYSNLKNTTVVNRWIKDEEVGSFFNGDNIVTVLPYIDATQSGVTPIAMDYRSIIIASNTGGLSEQIKDGETGYLFETSNSLDLYKKMKFVVENYHTLDKIKDNAQEYIKSLSWDVLAQKLKSVVR